MGGEIDRGLKVRGYHGTLSKLLVISGASLVVIVTFIILSTLRTRVRWNPNIKNDSYSGKCKNGYEYVVFQTGKTDCVKIPDDAGKLCKNNSECESGYCVTRKAKALDGTCFDSNAHMPCIKGFWTVEESQTKIPKEDLPENIIQDIFCLY